VQGGEARGAYTHPKFIQKNRASCLEIRRKAAAGRSSSRSGAIAGPKLEISPMSDHFKQAIYASRPWSQRTRQSDGADDKERYSAASTEDEEASLDGCSPAGEGDLVRAVSLERSPVLVGAGVRTMKVIPSHVVEQKRRISQTSYNKFAVPSSLKKAVAFLKASPVNPTEKPNAATVGTNAIFRVNSLEERVDEGGASNLVAAGMIELLPSSFRYEDPGFPSNDISLIESVDEMIWEDGLQYPALDPENPW
jgi:hypothetical protein